MSGATSLEEFRSTFDQKTRREWASFGAKGLSGVMVLNQLAKHAPDVALDRHPSSVTSRGAGRARRVVRCLYAAATLRSRKSRILGMISSPLSSSAKWPVSKR